MEVKDNISDALLVGAATLGGYTVAFAYELGYTIYFGIPRQLIAVGLTQVLLTASMLAALLVVLLLYINNYADMFLFREKLPEVYSRRLIELSFLIMFAVIIFLYHPNWKIAVIVFSLPVFAFLLLFGLPLLTQRKTEGYRNKLVAHDAMMPRPRTLFEAGVRRAGVSWLVLSFCFLMVVFAAFGSGWKDATDQEWFECHVNSPDRVVLRIYGDVVIDGKLDASTGRLTGVFVVTKIGEGTPLEFQKRKVGPLQPAS